MAVFHETANASATRATVGAARPGWGTRAHRHRTEAAAGARRGPGLWRIKDRSFVYQHQLHPDELALFDTTGRMVGSRHALDDS